jgi:selenocysteine lyase/cysteine desulfurase
VNDNLIWLNNCGTTPASKIAVASVTNYLQGYSKEGIYSPVEQYNTVKVTIKNILGKLLNCYHDELAIIHNTSEGINFISLGLSLEQGDEILLLENEYPSNVYPWEHWKEKGVIVKFISMADTPLGFLENFKSTLSPFTKVVSISAVHWCTGMPLPLLEIGKICKDRNIIFVVDGAQGVGHIPIDVKEMNISFMAFAGWKWLLGPLGIGILYINKEKLDSLKPIFKGTMSVKDGENYFPYKTEHREGADRFEFSTGNFNDWVYLKSSLVMLSEIGFENIFNRIYELSDHLAIGLKKIGFTLSSEKFSEKTGIICAIRKGISSAKLSLYLREKGIVTADRLGMVRFSPHIYNTFEQLDSVLTILQDYQE